MALPTLVSWPANTYPLNDTRNYTVSRYGTNSSNAVSYNQAPVGITDTVTSAKWNSIRSQINQERVRRGKSIESFTDTSPISAIQFNALRTALNISGPAADQAYATSGSTAVTTFPQVGPPTLPTAATQDVTQITAVNMNALISALNDSGAACTCNCNYCTCNCNYCTCNCNYACTCDCNYSDRRLKCNIEFIGITNGLKIYSFNYIWDKTKMIGVMAQDLLKTKYKNAVSKDVNGFYMVDYNQLPIVI